MRDVPNTIANLQQTGLISQRRPVTCDGRRPSSVTYTMAVPVIGGKDRWILLDPDFMCVKEDRVLHGRLPTENPAKGIRDWAMNKLQRRGGE